MDTQKAALRWRPYCSASRSPPVGPSEFLCLLSFGVLVFAPHLELRIRFADNRGTRSSKCGGPGTRNCFNYTLVLYFCQPIFTTFYRKGGAKLPDIRKLDGRSLLKFR